MKPALPKLHVSIWFGLWASKGTPKDVVSKLNAAVKGCACADPQVREKLAALGQAIPPVDKQSPEALRVHQKAEIDKWWPIVKAANITTIRREIACHMNGARQPVG